MSRGRLIKKSDQDKNSSVKVEDYPWTDFSTESILLPDNPRKSVIQSKSHSVQEMETKVKSPTDFSRVLSAPVKPILPQDLTAEFLASQEELRQRKRRMQMDEDEAVALELLDLEDGLSSSDELKSDTTEMIQNANFAASENDKGQTRATGPDISDLSAFSAENKLEIDDGSFSFSEKEVAQSQEIQEKIAAAFERGLQQGKLEGEKVGYEAALSSVQQPSIEGHERSEAAEESNKQSFEDGVEQGKQEAREVALLEAEEKFSHSVKLFTSALTELQHLKGELISTGREIFAEIAQICAEKVLRTTVKLNDDALRKIYESATSQFSLDSKLQIEMHPEDLARLEPHIAEPEKDRIRLVANDKITQGDLKIEANNEVISLDLHNTVQQIIDTLKDDLFESVKKDDSTDKAG